MKTSETTPIQIDWLVAKCEDQPLYWNAADSTFYMGDGELWMRMRGDNCYCPSTDWIQGGPIIEREGIDLQCQNQGLWCADLGLDSSIYGPTPLIAAMRCYVASKLGDEVELPSVVEKIGL